jgi:hypothetical protein
VFTAATQGLPKHKDPTKLIGDEIYYEKRNVKAQTHSSKGFAKTYSTEYIILRTLMLFGSIFLHYMSEPRASVRRVTIYS